MKKLNIIIFLIIFCFSFRVFATVNEGGNLLGKLEYTFYSDCCKSDGNEENIQEKDFVDSNFSKNKEDEENIQKKSFVGSNFTKNERNRDSVHEKSFVDNNYFDNAVNDENIYEKGSMEVELERIKNFYSSSEINCNEERKKNSKFKEYCMEPVGDNEDLYDELGSYGFGELVCNLEFLKFDNLIENDKKIRQRCKITCFFTKRNPSNFEKNKNCIASITETIYIDTDKDFLGTNKYENLNLSDCLDLIKNEEDEYEKLFIILISGNKNKGIITSEKIFKIVFDIVKKHSTLLQIKK